MTNESDLGDDAQNNSFRRQMREEHRSAFDIHRCLAQLMEEAIVKPRSVEDSFAQALDLLYIQAFKSYQALYYLCVNGLEEDAATIERRLFEIALQVGFLCLDDNLRIVRGEKFLAYFWHNAKDIASALDLPADRRKWWEDQYNRNKKWLKLNKNGEPATAYWFDSTFKDIAKEIGVENIYDEDYRLLSNIAHCSPRSLGPYMKSSNIQIHGDSITDMILVYGTRYVLCTAECWNEHFATMDGAKLEEIKNKALNFDFKKK